MLKTERLYGYRMVVNVSVVHPHDPMPDWELQLFATAQHHEGELYCPVLAPEKNKSQNLKYISY